MTVIDLIAAARPVAPLPVFPSARPAAPRPLASEGDAAAAVVQPGSVLIFCDGGLANRVNSLVGGLVLAERLGRPHTILWPRNNRCGAAFGELLDMPDAVAEVRLSDLVAHEDRLQLWLHENDVGFTRPIDVLRRLDAPGAQALLHAADGRVDPNADGRAILYCENAVLRWLPDADVRRAQLRLRLRPEILGRAREILAREAPQGHVGIHLRGTDFGAPPPVDAMLQAVASNPALRFFVCSDDPAIEARFAGRPNVFMNAKSAYVDKLTDGPWRQPVKDSDGLPYGSNIERSGRSVVDACVDLLLLAASTPVQTSHSSFLALAQQLRAIGWVAQHLALPRPAAEPSPGPAPQADSTPTPPASPMTTQQEVLELLQRVRPRQMLSDHKVRIGSPGDGGYVMPSLALRTNAVLSIGIGGQVSFDAALADRGAMVLQFDHTIEGPPEAHANFRFHALGWGPRDEGPLRSTHTMMQGLDWTAARHPVLKFDTEGAEWDALAATADEDLARFEVIAGEFHGFHNLHVRSELERFRAVLDKLHRHHVPVHLHANNATGVRLVQGVPVPPLLEITFVRRDMVATAGWCTDPIPGPLDAPNMADRPDICLRPF